jgi:hypothetical protein
MSDGQDDLPRTFRREREARDRAAAAAQAPQPPQYHPDPATQGYGAQVYGAQPAYTAQPAFDHDDRSDGVVRKFRVPFLSLVAFFMKAAVAAIPGLFLLAGLLWGASYVMQKMSPGGPVKEITFKITLPSIK